MNGKTIKLLEENIISVVGKDFLNRTLKGTDHEGKNNEMDFIKIINFYSSKATTKSEQTCHRAEDICSTYS